MRTVVRETRCVWQGAGMRIAVCGRADQSHTARGTHGEIRAYREVAGEERGQRLHGQGRVAARAGVYPPATAGNRQYPPHAARLSSTGNASVTGLPSFHSVCDWRLRPAQAVLPA